MKANDLEFLTMAVNHMNDPTKRYAFQCSKANVERILELVDTYGKARFNESIIKVKELLNANNDK
jgi:histidyl-tRNA synthetase